MGAFRYGIIEPIALKPTQSLAIVFDEDPPLETTPAV